MSVRVLALKSGETTAESHRLGLGLFVQPSGGALERRAGIVPSSGAADLVTVSAMAAKITPFVAWVDGTSNALQGGYPVVSDADVTLTFDPGEAALARIDQVIVRVKDSAYDAGLEQAGSVEILKGNPATGAATALPPSSMALWQVTVPAGASAGTGGINFATARLDRRRNTAGLGGVVVVKDATDRDTLGTYEGLTVWRTDVQAVQTYSGGAWRWPSILSTASAADRNGKVPSPLPGQLVFRTDLKAHDYWDGTAWRSEGDWTAVSFQGTWGNFGSGFQTAQYRKDITGWVHVRGLISGTGSPAGTTAFTLPAGFRPPAALSFACLSSSAATPTVSRVTVQSSGVVTPGDAYGSFVSVNFSFDAV